MVGHKDQSYGLLYSTFSCVIFYFTGDANIARYADDSKPYSKVLVINELEKLCHSL